MPGLRAELRPDFVVANGENVAGGSGITDRVAKALLRAGVDLITGGNHSWRHPGIFENVELAKYVLRPMNYANAPGRGWAKLTRPGSQRLAVVSLQGRVNMPLMPDCPFMVLDRVIAEIGPGWPIIVDFHAEATSEKISLGWYADGRISALVGSHTHVPTADERVLPGGTAYITDMGMTGPKDSVIGIRKEIAIHKFITQRPITHKVAKDDITLEGVLVVIDSESGRANSITRLREPYSGTN